MTTPSNGVVQGVLPVALNVSLPIGKSKILDGEGWILPASGEVGEGCGQILHMVCPSCGHHWEGESRCKRRSCPHCGVLWASLEARKASARLWIGWHKLSAIQKRNGRLLHIVVSVNPKVAHERDVRELRSDAYALCRRHGVLGGTCVIHPFRDDDDGNYTEDGLHFHIVGYAPADVVAGDGKDGMLFKVVRDAKRGDFRGFQRMREVRHCLAYELSHAGIKDNLHGLTWWGAMAYNNLSQQTLLDEYPEAFAPPEKRCPACGGTDIRVVVDVGGEWVERIYDRTAWPAAAVLSWRG